MSDGPLSPEEVAHRGFPTAFRGFETGEVRAYLQRVATELRASTARERELHRRLADAEHRAAHPVIEGEALTRALGEEMGRILASAHQAAADLKSRAEDNAARILREAHEQAQRIRAAAELVLAERTEEADAQAAEIRRAAAAEAAGVVERARREADEATAQAETRGRQVVQEAQAARARVLGDLTRRRRLMQMQVEQLRAGRERLLEVYRTVRRTTDEVADELQRAEGEAREAAAAAGDRAGADMAEIDDVLAAFPAPSEPGAGTAGETPVPVPPTADGAGEADAPNPDLASVEELLTTEVGPEGAGEDGAGETHEAASARTDTGSGASAPEPDPPDPPRSSTLRLLRRHRGDPRPAGLDLVDTPSDVETVRVIGTRPGGTGAGAGAAGPSGPPPPPERGANRVPSSPADRVPPAPPDRRPDAAASEAATSVPVAPVRPQQPAAGAEAEAVAGPSSGAPAASEDHGPPGARERPSVAEPSVAVDELFARIRAGRADAVAKAQEVLRSEPADPTLPTDAEPPAAADATPSSSVPAAEETPSSSVPAAGEEALLQRRDHAVEGLESKLARKLKRVLQDEQNELLDRLRSARAGAAVLAPPPEQAARYAQAAEEVLAASAAAGVAFMTPGSVARPRVDDLAAGLAASVAEPLRRALERALAGDTGGADAAAVVERIGSVYRECKAQRIEGLAGDAVTAAFSRGALTALPPGSSSRWVVDDDGRPCPDCDDNALAGPTPPGDTYPTGQSHPPAHAGCRCLLAPAQVTAAVNGSA